MSHLALPSDVFLIKPDENLVASFAEDFRRELQVLVERGHINLAIDLSAIDMIDSRGLAVFVMGYKSVAARGGRLFVLTNNTDFRRLFEVTHINEYVTILDAD